VDNVKTFVAFSVALDESTDISDTAQLVIYIRGVDKELNVTEDFLDLVAMTDTTTGIPGPSSPIITSLGHLVLGCLVLTSFVLFFFVPKLFCPMFCMSSELSSSVLKGQFWWAKHFYFFFHLFCTTSLQPHIGALFKGRLFIFFFLGFIFSFYNVTNRQQ